MYGKECHDFYNPKLKFWENILVLFQYVLLLNLIKPRGQNLNVKLRDNISFLPIIGKENVVSVLAKFYIFWYAYMPTFMMFFPIPKKLKCRNFIFKNICAKTYLSIIVPDLNYEEKTQLL